MHLQEFQQLIERIYYEKDSARGVDGSFRWFVEEVGELAQAIRSGKIEELNEEFGDTLAWLSTLASMSGVNLEDAVRKYAKGCPRCQGTPCRCP